MLLRAGRTSAQRLMGEAVAAARQDRFGAISYLRPTQEWGQVAAPNHGPFRGIPLLVKDLGAPFRGLALRCGSEALAGDTGEADSDLAERFRQAGFVPFGTTTAPEFGLSLDTAPKVGPRTVNPLDPRRIAGGSSGGSAAAVASGIVPLAHATDAGGSIRVPAACCGLVGLKPSRGAIPGGPGFGNHLGGIASEFALTRSVRDARTLFDCLTGPSPGPFPAPDLSDVDGGRLLTVGILDRLPDGSRPEPQLAEVLLDAAEFLAHQGHHVVTIEPGELAPLTELSGKAFDAIVSANLAVAFGPGGLDPARTEPLTQAFIERGQSMSAADLWNAEFGAVQAAYRMKAIWASCDALLVPMLRCLPPLLGAFPTDHRDPALQLRRMSDFAPYATLANVAGVPALSLPFGSTGELPLAVQIMAPMGRDLRVLRLGAQLEAAQRWTLPFALELGHDLD